MAYKTITSVEELRQVYLNPKPRAIGKSMTSLDVHCRDFLAAAPFLVLATTGTDGRSDASPRGGAPGFVKVIDDKRILMGDKPGNNRLDSLVNILEHPNVGMLFMIPGTYETLRINGTAEITNDEELLAAVANKAGRVPKTGLLVTVQEVYLHCPVALNVAKIWNPDTWATENPLAPADDIWAAHYARTTAEKPES